MAFNTVGQYSPNHKVWDHVGNILPKVEHSEGIRPSIEWQVAEWLPVQFFDKYYENWMVLLSGKLVALDNDNRVVPAGLKVAVELAASGTVVTYTQNDVDAGTINVTTGLPVIAGDLSSGSVNYTAAQINTAGFMGRDSVDIKISHPVGVAPYAYLQHAGGDGSNPALMRQHNYQMQHQVAVLCDYVLELPLVPATVASAEAMTFGAPVTNISTGTALSNLPVAVNTVRTPLTFAGGASATLFINQVSAASLIRAAGDWHIDLDTGVVKVYATVQPTSITLVYSHYASAPTSVSKFACAVGDLKGGDLVTFDANSNFRLASATNLYIGDTSLADESGNIARAHGLVVGQVLDVEVHPRDFLDRVKTQLSPTIGTDAAGSKPGYLGQMDQMPGTATGGVPFNIHYAGAADRVVRINLTRF